MGRPRQDTPELTPRQREVLDLVARGHTNREIAEALGISANGAKWHVGELLAKFGVATREELADRGSRERNLWTRADRWLAATGGLSMGKGLVVVATATVIAATVAAVLVLAMAGEGDGAAPSSQPSSSTTPGSGTTRTAPAATLLPTLTQPELRLTGEGNGLKMWVAPGADLTATIGVLDGDLGGNILLVDQATGLVLGKLEVGYGPWAVFRRSAGELLIAHQPLGPPKADGGRDQIGGTSLVVVDLATLRVKGEVPLPQRSFYTTYVAGMKLTDDDRYLFYAAVYQRQDGTCTADEERTRPIGTEGHCDRQFVGTIDLRAATPAATLVEVPLVNCSYGPPRVVDGHTGYVVCIDGATYAVDASNPKVITKVVDATSRPNEIDPVLSHNLANAVTIVREPGGASGILYSSGQFLLQPPAGPERKVGALPNGTSLGFNAPTVLGRRIYLPYRDGYSVQTMSGMAVFDWQRGLIERDLLFEPAISVHIIDERTVLILLEDGRLQRIDLQTGRRVVLGGRLALSQPQADFLP